MKHPGTVHRGVSQTEQTSGRAERAARSQQLAETRAGTGTTAGEALPPTYKRSSWGEQETRSATNRAGKHGMEHQKGCGAEVCVAVHEEGHAGRELKLCQLDWGAMVSNQQKDMAAPSSAPTLNDAASQTELQWEHTSTQVSGCRVCPTVTPVWDDRSECTCERCTQVEQLLHLVTEVCKEVSRLRSIQDCERENDYWNCILSSQRQAGHAARTQDTGSSLSSLSLTNHSDLRDRG